LFVILKGGDGAKMIQDVRRWLVDDFLSRRTTINIPNLKIKKEETIMKKSNMKITILGCISVFLIASLVLLPAKQSKAETLVENSLFFRTYLAFSVDQKAAQEWLPARYCQMLCTALGSDPVYFNTVNKFYSFNYHC